MPTVPAIGELTICELNRTFLTSSGDDDIEAQNAYGKILGRVYPFIPYVLYQSVVEASGSLDSGAEDEHVRHGDSIAVKGNRNSRERRDLTEDMGVLALLVKQLTTFRHSLDWFSTTHHVDLLKKVELSQGVCWHKQKPSLAFLSGAGQVIVYNFEKPDSEHHSILSSGSQNGAAAIAWRPSAGMTLSVACRSE